jgi:nucleotide-binding universal stress UspA family protein
MLLRVVPTPLQVAPIGAALTPSAELWEAWEKEPELARDYLAGIAKGLLEDGLQAHTKVVDGDPATCIVECATQDPSIMMIAMSTHGRSGLGRWVFGSVADKVLHAAPVPLLLVRSSESESETDSDGPVQVHSPHHYHTILVPLDGSSFAEQALWQARVLAAASGANQENDSGAKLVLVSVVPTPSAWQMADDTSISLWAEAAERDETNRLNLYLLETAQQFRSQGHIVQTRLCHGDPAEEILRSGEETNADIIVMATHGRGGLRRLWLGSVATKVVQGATVPVLLVRAEEHDELQVQRAGQSDTARGEHEQSLTLC